jgi:formylmethanofuran:tetrahydromethanopterin formyltransferase
MNEDHALVDNTFCEVFSAYFARILITAATDRWAMESALEAKGLGVKRITTGNYGEKLGSGRIYLRDLVGE